MATRNPHPRKILIASDDEAWLGSVSRAFTAEGYIVRTARTGQNAFDLLQTERFDIAVFSVDMPKMGGLEVLRRVRESPFIAGLPVVLTGPDAGLQALRAAWEAGADDYIRIPLSTPMFLLRTAMVLGRAERMDPLSQATITGRFSARVCAEIFQLFNRAKRTGLLRVVNGPSVTSLWFENGEIVFARDDTDEGLQAVYNLVRTADARFEFLEGEKAPGRNVNRPFMFLVLEFARKLDTYVASRRKTIGDDLEREEKRLNALEEKGARKYLPDLIENSRKVVESVRRRLVDRRVERAYESVRKLHESIDWMELELERLLKGENDLRRATARLRRTAAGRKKAAEPISTAVAAPEAPSPAEEKAEKEEKKAAGERREQREEEPAPEPEAAGEETSPPEETAAAGEPEAKEAAEAASQEEAPATESGAAAETAEEDKTVAGEPSGEAEPAVEGESAASAEEERKEEGEEEEKIDTREFLLAGLKREVNGNGEEAEAAEAEGAVAAVMESTLDLTGAAEEEGKEEEETAQEEEAEGEKAEAETVPRLIQRFPPDIVEMMQAELARDEPPLASPRAFAEFKANIRRTLKPRTVGMDGIVKVLSEAFYSRANVLSVLVSGRPEELARFFTRATERVLAPPDEESAYLVKVPGGLDHTLYIIGMRYDVMDSFEAENILDRCMAAVLLGSPDELSADLVVDALSLTLVKYRRTRVFVTGAEGTLPRKVGLALERYSLPPECRRMDFDYGTESARELLSDVITALHEG